MSLSKLDELESRSIFIVREAYQQYRNIALLWSIGKDSSALLWICRKAFFGKLPFPVLHIDTGYKFPEMYEFRDQYAREWGLNMLIWRNEKAIADGMSPQTSKLGCCGALKTEALKQAIAHHGFSGLLLGIRRDEHGVRAKERYFSPRDESFAWDYQNQPPELWNLYKSRYTQGTHVRIHPMLHWSELDIWTYIRRERIPITGLYYARNGLRYRSIGCKTCCSPAASSAANLDQVIDELATTHEAERAGRAQDKESAYTMQKLRAMGYM